MIVSAHHQIRDQRHKGEPGLLDGNHYVVPADHLAGELSIYDSALVLLPGEQPIHECSAEKEQDSDGDLDPASPHLQGDLVFLDLRCHLLHLAGSLFRFLSGCLVVALGAALNGSRSFLLFFLLSGMAEGEGSLLFLLFV